MLFEQIMEKQRQQVEKLQQTPVGGLRKEIDALKDRLLEQGKAIKELQETKVVEKSSAPATVSVVSSNENTDFTDMDREILHIIRGALDSEVPVMPLKITPESGVRTLGLPIPMELRERLMAQQERYNIESYKAVVLACMRIGVQILETSVPEEVEEYVEDDIEELPEVIAY